MSGQIFNPQTKTFYRPIDAALRWCNLIRHEAEIIRADEICPERLGKIFPQWPCLQANLEKLYDAMRNGELPYQAVEKFSPNFPNPPSLKFFSLSGLALPFSCRGERRKIAKSGRVPNVRDG
jgi:hypothetical protein